MSPRAYCGMQIAVPGGDGAVDLANEQCDIADQGTCGPTDTCSFDCQCQP